MYVSLFLPPSWTEAQGRQEVYVRRACSDQARYRRRSRRGEEGRSQVWRYYSSWEGESCRRVRSRVE